VIMVLPADDPGGLPGARAGRLVRKAARRGG
jgi:hypothetical protein